MMSEWWANDERMMRWWWDDEQMTTDWLLADYWLTTGMPCDFCEIAAHSLTDSLTWVVSGDGSASKKSAHQQELAKNLQKVSGESQEEIFLRWSPVFSVASPPQLPTSAEALSFFFNWFVFFFFVSRFNLLKYSEPKPSLLVLLLLLFQPLLRQAQGTPGFPQKQKQWEKKIYLAS